MKTGTIFSFLIVTVICLQSAARDCDDTLYSRLTRTPIIKMNNNEYEYYRKHEGRCDSYNNWIDSQIIWISKKQLSEMSNNEADYFADRATDMSWCKPCSLMQYLVIQDKNINEMSKYERILYNSCKEKCIRYMEEHPTTNAGIARLKWKKARFYFLGIFGVTLGIACFLLLSYPSGPK